MYVLATENIALQQQKPVELFYTAGICSLINELRADIRV